MRHPLLLYFLLAVCLFSPLSLTAKADIIDSCESHNYDYLLFGLGIYDIIDDEKAADFRVEYRHGTPFIWEIKPFLAAEVTSHASVWAGAGIYMDLNLTDNVIFTPSFGAGVYAKGSSDLDLGYPLEFRSQLELSYEFENTDRISLGVAHISNASLDEDNPGTEILSLSYHIPFDRIF